jgi:Zn-dependent protease with chaperone function
MYILIGLSMVLTAALLVAVGTSITLTLLWPILRRLAKQLRPRSESRFWLLVGLAPALMGISTALLVAAPGYLRFEPRDTHEQITVRMCLLAAFSLLLFLISVTRSAWVLLKTRRVSDCLRRSGRPLSVGELPYEAFEVPAASGISIVMGIRNPTLFFSRAVLDSLSAPEFEAVLRHEQAHVKAGDNAVSLLLEGGFLLSANPLFANLVRPRWLESTEMAADGAAVRDEKDAFEMLAALVKVARLREGTSIVAGLGCSFVPPERQSRLRRRIEQLRIIADGNSGATEAPGRGLAFGFAAVAFLATATAMLPSAMVWAHRVLETLLMK